MLAQKHGEHIFLTLHEARTLENQGLVEIIESINTDSIVDTSYLTKENYVGAGNKILWVQDTHGLVGGAELTNAFTVEIGNNLGFDIVGVCNIGKFEKLVDECELIIVNNIIGNLGLADAIIKSGKKYVLFSHDYRKIPNELAKNTKLIMCLSPAHALFMQKNYGTLNIMALPLCIKTSLFKPVERKNENVLFVPVPLKQKDLDKINPFDYACDKIVFGGDMCYIDTINYMQQVKHVYHCPECNETGGRVLLEAILAGATVHTNDTCGHTSWEFWNNKEQLLPALNAAPYLFWKEVEKCLV